MGNKSTFLAYLNTLRSEQWGAELEVHRFLAFLHDLFEQSGYIRALPAGFVGQVLKFVLRLSDRFAFAASMIGDVKVVETYTVPYASILGNFTLCINPVNVYQLAHNLAASTSISLWQPLVAMVLFAEYVGDEKVVDQIVNLSEELGKAKDYNEALLILNKHVHQNVPVEIQELSSRFFLYAAVPIVIHELGHILLDHVNRSAKILSDFAVDPERDPLLYEALAQAVNLCVDVEVDLFTDFVMDFVPRNYPLVFDPDVTKDRSAKHHLEFKTVLLHRLLPALARSGVLGSRSAEDLHRMFREGVGVFPKLSRQHISVKEVLKSIGARMDRDEYEYTAEDLAALLLPKVIQAYEQELERCRVDPDQLGRAFITSRSVEQSALSEVVLGMKMLKEVTERVYAFILEAGAILPDEGALHHRYRHLLSNMIKRIELSKYSSSPYVYINQIGIMLKELSQNAQELSQTIEQMIHDIEKDENILVVYKLINKELDFRFRRYPPELVSFIRTAGSLTPHQPAESVRQTVAEAIQSLIRAAKDNAAYQNLVPNLINASKQLNNIDSTQKLIEHVQTIAAETELKLTQHLNAHRVIDSSELVTKSSLELLTLSEKFTRHPDTIKQDQTLHRLFAESIQILRSLQQAFNFTFAPVDIDVTQYLQRVKDAAQQAQAFIAQLAQDHSATTLAQQAIPLLESTQSAISHIEQFCANQLGLDSDALLLGAFAPLSETNVRLTSLDLDLATAPMYRDLNQTQPETLALFREKLQNLVRQIGNLYEIAYAVPEAFRRLGRSGDSEQLREEQVKDNPRQTEPTGEGSCEQNGMIAVLSTAQKENASATACSTRQGKGKDTRAPATPGMPEIQEAYQEAIRKLLQAHEQLSKQSESAQAASVFVKQVFSRVGLSLPTVADTPPLLASESARAVEKALSEVKQSVEPRQILGAIAESIQESAKAIGHSAGRFLGAFLWDQELANYRRRLNWGRLVRSAVLSSLQQNAARVNGSHRRTWARMPPTARINSIPMPGVERTPPEIVVIADCSMSMSQTERRLILSTLYNNLKDIGKIRLVVWDVGLYMDAVLNSVNAVKTLRFPVDGGTEINKAIDYVGIRYGSSAACVLVLTDCYSDFTVSTPPPCSIVLMNMSADQGGYEYAKNANFPFIYIDLQGNVKEVNMDQFRAWAQQQIAQLKSPPVQQARLELARKAREISEQAKGAAKSL